MSHIRNIRQPSFFNINIFSTKVTIMHSLELRRLHIFVICCYKIVFGLVDVACDDLFYFRSFSVTRAHAYSIPINLAVNILLEHARFFENCIIGVWNFLPSTVNVPALTSYRRSLDFIDLSAYLKWCMCVISLLIGLGQQ